MCPKDMLRALKSKLESDSSIQEEQLVVTDINDNSRESKVVVMKKIQGSIQMIEVSARILGHYVAPL